MNKREIEGGAMRILQKNRARKSVSFPKTSFKISDECGDEHSFSVMHQPRMVAYTADDVRIVFDAIIATIINAVENGERVCISGLFDILIYKKLSVISKGDTDPNCVPTRRYCYFPRIKAGLYLRKAAKSYASVLPEHLIVPSEDDADYASHPVNKSFRSLSDPAADTDSVDDNDDFSDEDLYDDSGIEEDSGGDVNGNTNDS